MTELLPPPEYTLADEIGKLTNGKQADIAIMALLMNLCHIMYISSVSLDEITVLIEAQLRRTSEIMQEVRKIN